MVDYESFTLQIRNEIRQEHGLACVSFLRTRDGLMMGATRLESLTGLGNAQGMFG